jgi:hypothetical protein
MMAPIENRCDYCADYDEHCVRCNPLKPVPLWQSVGCMALTLFVILGFMAVTS